APKASRTTSSSPVAARPGSSSTGRCSRASRSRIRPPSARSPSRRSRRLTPAQATSQVFLNQAASSVGRSRLYVDLLTAWADDPVAAKLVGPDPAWDAPLRLIGGRHSPPSGGEGRAGAPVPA